MKNLTVKALILGKKIISDNDKILFIYCEELGKLKVIAKGANKILSRTTGHLETLNLVQISLYFGPRNIILSEIQTIRYFPKIREDFSKLKFAFQIAEITEKTITENQQVKNLLPLIESTLQTINDNQNTNQLQILTFAYIVKLLDKLGLIPDFHNLDNKKNHPEKYLKFLHYTKTNPLQSIQKITITPIEEMEIEKILTSLIETHAFSTIKTFSTPSSASNPFTNFFKESASL